MEALNLNLKFEKLERHTVVVAKRRGSEIFNFVFNFVMWCMCVCIMWYVCV